MTFDVLTRAAGMEQQRKEGRRPLGWPCASDFPDTEKINDLRNRFFNNAGDPQARGPFPWHTKDLEQIVVDFHARLFRAPEKYWGYVAPSGSQATLTALRIARAQLGTDAMVYYWASAHHSVADAIDILGLRSIRLRIREPWDVSEAEQDFARQVEAHRDCPAIVVATAGTTMTEWVDDVQAIRDVLERALIPYYIHVDGALSAVPLALLPGEARPHFDFQAGADSIFVSGHKFYGVLDPCAVLVVRDGLQSRLSRAVDYISPDAILAYGSRSGQTPLLWAFAIDHWGVEGLTRRASEARAVAAYALDRLRSEVSHHWFRNVPGFTVVYPGVVDAEIVKDYALAVQGDRTHLITMPGVTRAMIDELVKDLANHASGGA